MTQDERDQVIRRLYNLFPAIKNLVAEEELDEWHDTLTDLDFLIASLTLTLGKRQWRRLPSHAEFLDLYDETAPREEPKAPRPGDPLRCDGKLYVLIDADLAADFAGESEVDGAAQRLPAVEDYRAWKAHVDRQLAGANGPLANSLSEAIAAELAGAPK